MIDTNVYLSRWPFRRLPGDEPEELVAKLRTAGVDEAWAGSFDALLHRDAAGVNARLAADCKRFGAGRLIPIGTVNPKLPDWQEDLRRCHEEHRMPGIRLHPNYHGYRLDEPVARELLQGATERKLFVQIVHQMEDERTTHPLVRVPPVDLTPLAALIPAIAGLRVQLLNVRAVPRDLMKNLAVFDAFSTDFAMIESVHGLKRLAADVGLERVVLGSYFPFYYLEAALLKVKESDLDSKPILDANARRLRGGTR